MDLNELKRFLETCPSEMRVVLQADAEGNSYGTLDTISTSARFVAHSPWSGRTYLFGCDQPSVKCVIFHADHVCASSMNVKALLESIAAINTDKVILSSTYFGDRLLQGATIAELLIYDDWIDSPDTDSSDSSGSSGFGFGFGLGSDLDAERVKCVVLYPIN
jgi:hypothetical protein